MICSVTGGYHNDSEIMDGIYWTKRNKICILWEDLRHGPRNFEIKRQLVTAIEEYKKGKDVEALGKLSSDLWDQS